MINLATKYRIYDFFHRGAVRVCLTITVVGHIYLGYRAIRYYAFDRKVLREQELLRIKNAIESDETIKA